MTAQSIKFKHLIGILITLIIVVGCSGAGNSDPASIDQEQPQTPTPSPMAEDPVETEIVSLTELEVGTCMNILVEANGIEYVSTMDCNQAHYYQYAGSAQLVNFTDEYPGRIAIERVIKQTCWPVFQDYTGQAYNALNLGIETIGPSLSSWQDGDREVMCMIVNADRSPMFQSHSQ